MESAMSLSLDNPSPLREALSRAQGEGRKVAVSLPRDEAGSKTLVR